jgi:hypothetical protein
LLTLADAIGNVPEPKPERVSLTVAGEPPAMMTADETITYLRLADDDRDPAERLRNLVRRQGLPLVKRGKLRLFRRAAVDAWLDGNYPVSGRAARPAKQSQENAA